jgi:hypothetical protein
MRKKAIIGGSIGAVVLLVLCSLVNVVGYESVKSTEANESPLFSVRTKRAINQESKSSLTSDYLGKDFNTLLFPLRDNRTALIQKFINKIRTMDDDTFNRFIDYTVNQINHKKNLKVVNIKEFIKELRQLRESTQNIIVDNDSDISLFTFFPDWDPVPCWFPGKLLLMLMAIPFTFFVILIFIINVIIGTPTMQFDMPECMPDMS